VAPTSIRFARIAVATLAVAVGTPGCSSTCKAGDLSCALASMTWTNFGADGGNGITGPVQTLVAVDPIKLDALASSAADGGIPCDTPDAGADAGPAVVCPARLTLTPILSTITFYESGSDGSLVGLEWTDPYGCLPAFCMSACPKGGECIGARCSPSIHDGIESSITLHWVTYNVPDGSDFDLRIIAVSAPGCPSDVSSAINTGAAGLAFSAPILVEMQVTDQGIPSTTSTGTGSGSSGGSGGGAGSIVGTWKASTDSTQGAATTIGSTIYTFNSDGSEQYVNDVTTTYTDGTPSATGDCTAPGSYTVSGNSVTIVTPSPPAECGTILSPFTTTWSVSGNELTFGGDPSTYFKQ
jgi:hypothetical protein